MAKSNWEGKHYSYFCNKDCEYFPCHPTKNTDNFNCLFCYCPLYVLGEACGGNYTYLENGIKNCSNCLFPHKRENYGKIMARYPEIAALLAGPKPSESQQTNRRSLCSDK